MITGDHKITARAIAQQAGIYQEGDEVKIFADSQLIINQLKGSYKIKKAHLKKFNDVIISILSHFNYTLTHVLRDANKVADKLSNEAIDQKIKLDSQLVSKLNAYEIYL